MVIRTLSDCKKVYRKHGFGSLVTPGKLNPKTAKSDKRQTHLSMILHLSPANRSGYEMCPFRSDGCTAACLHTAGNPAYMSAKEKTRIARTVFYMENRELFKACLRVEIAAHVRRAERANLKPSFRPNGTSDQVWEKVFPEMFSEFPMVQFYDYTAIPSRLMPEWKLPENYHLTFSRKENNDAAIMEILRKNPKANVAVVFKGAGISRFPKPFPETWNGRPVHDADMDDERFKDPEGCIAGLRAKGDAMNDDSGFCIELPQV